MAAKLASVPLQPLPQPEQIISGGQRLDGRGFEEFRQVFVSTKVLTQATGSAYAEIGGTKVMVAVYGPRQSERKFGFSDTGRLTCEVTFTSWARKSQDMSRQARVASEREVSATVQQALEASVQLHLFPKAAVDVFCIVLEAAGGEVAAAITAASLALADAGIPLYDLVPACAVSVHEGQLLLDPSAHEASRQQGGLMLALMPSANEVTQMTLTGSWSNSLSRDALELAMGGCTQLKALMRQALLGE